jgi:hypothetical protein
MKIQQARPQTLAYGLTDSPVGQLAWTRAPAPDLLVSDLRKFFRSLR